MRNKYSSIGKSKNEEGNETTGRLPRIKRGLVVLTAVGVGAFVLGNITGIKAGRRLGFDDGVLHTVSNFSEGIKILADKFEESNKGK